METTKNGKTIVKKVWKDPPSEGLSKNDHKVLKRVTRKCWRLDLAFSMCGLRLGWSAVIGIIPVVGDFINVFLAMKIIRLAQTVDGGLPPFVLSKMMTNIVIDFLLGITPILGTIAGALYKCNSRNSLILEHYLKKRAKENIKKGLFLVDASTAAGAKKKSWFTWGRTAQGEPENFDLEPGIIPTQAPKPVAAHPPPLPLRNNQIPSSNGQVSGSYQ